jgi:hypothetical protein
MFYLVIFWAADPGPSVKSRQFKFSQRAKEKKVSVWYLANRYFAARSERFANQVYENN